MRISQYTTSLLAAVLCTALWSCSGDEPDGGGDNGYGEEVSVSFTIEAPAATPVDGTEYRDPMPERSEELMHSWQIIFVDNNDNVVRTLSGSTDNLAGVREATVSGTVPKGRYTVYAFANMSEADIATYGGVSGAPGGTALKNLQFTGLVPYYGSVQDKPAIANAWDVGAKHVPMTGKRQVTVTGRTDETFRIEVIRLFGKVEFAFCNTSEHTITVNRVQFGPLVHGTIGAFRDPVSNGSPTAPILGNPVIADATWITRIADAEMGPGTDYKQGANAFCYVPESTPDIYDAKRYYILVDATRNGERVTLPYLTDLSVMKHINRNDYWQIPVNLSDWIVDFDVIFYPPIGGYPAVQKFLEGEQIYFTFGSQGAFAITPRIKQAGDGKPYLQPGQYSITVTLGDHTAGMFTKEPAPDTGTNEILGELSETPGGAEVKVEVRITTDAGTQAVYTRTLYIQHAK